MSSIELVKIINDLRDDDQAEMQHKHFLVKVPKVLGIKPAENLAGQYKAGNGQMQPCYNLPKREAQLMVMSESYKVQAAVYDRMIELEATPMPIINSQSVVKEFKSMLSLSKAFGLKGNQAILSANKAVKKTTGIDCQLLLGIELVADKKEHAITPSDIGVRLGGISGMKVNQLLKDTGLQIDNRTAKNAIYWTPTNKGTPYAQLTDTTKKHSDGTPIKQVKWYESVIDLISA